MAETEELKSLSVKVKGKSEKVGLILNIQKTNIMESGPITSWQIDEENNGNTERLFFWAPISLQMGTAVVKLKDTAPWKKSCNQPRQHIKN